MLAMLAPHSKNLSKSFIQSRKIATLRGTIVTNYPKSIQTIFIANNLNYQFLTEEAMYRTASSVESLGKADKSYAVVNYQQYKKEQLQQEGSMGELYALVQNIIPFISEFKLTTKQGKLSEEILSKVDVSRQTKRVIFAALNNQPLPLNAIPEPAVVLLEIAELVQKMIVFTDPDGDRFGSRFHRTRHDADRDMNGTRTHPTKGNGVFLENDEGSIIAIKYGVPVQCGTSGSSSTYLNGLANLGMDTSRPDFLSVQVPMLIKLAHSYLAGAIPLEIMQGTEQISSTVPEIVGKGIRKAVSEAVKNQDASFSQSLKAVEEVQTHTNIEIRNAMTKTALSIVEGEISPERSTALLTANAKDVAAELQAHKTRM